MKLVCSFREPWEKMKWFISKYEFRTLKEIDPMLLLLWVGYFPSSDLDCLCSCLRFVVDLVSMLPNFIEKLEEMVTSLRCSPTTEAHLAQLVSNTAPPWAHVRRLATNVTLTSNYIHWERMKTNVKWDVEILEQLRCFTVHMLNLTQPWKLTNVFSQR